MTYVPPTDPSEKRGLSGGVVALIAALALLVGVLATVVVVLLIGRSTPATTTTMVKAASPGATNSDSPRTSMPSSTEKQSPRPGASTPSAAANAAAAALTAGDRAAFVAVSKNERIGDGLYELFRLHWGAGPYRAAGCTTAGLGAKCQIYSGEVLAGTVDVEIVGDRAVVTNAVVEDTN